MKNFKEYLAESQRVYEYRIKFVGDVPADMLSALKEKLQQFDVVKFGQTKTTPVRKQIPDFPAYPNESMTIVDVEFRYPAIEPQIKQLAQLQGMDPNRVVMTTRDYNEELAKEYEKIDSENKNLLTDTDYPTPDKVQKTTGLWNPRGPYRGTARSTLDSWGTTRKE